MTYDMDRENTGDRAPIGPRSKFYLSKSGLPSFTYLQYRSFHRGLILDKSYILAYCLIGVSYTVSSGT